MSTPTADDFYAFVFNFEAGFAAYFDEIGLKVASPFVRMIPLVENGEQVLDATGAPVMVPDLAGVPAECMIVEFEPSDADPNVRAFSTRPEAEGWPNNRASDIAGFSGILSLRFRVPMDDEPSKPGEAPGCYARLLRRDGQIRALMRDTSPSFQKARDQLQAYDIISVVETQPERRVDTERSANERTQRYRITFGPRGGGAVTGF